MFRSAEPPLNMTYLQDLPLSFHQFTSFPPILTNSSTSLFTERISKQVAVQNTGLVMQ
jgi:hypothetical protein